MKEKIENVLEKLNPYLESDGGSVSFFKFEDGICYLEFHGHCATCPYHMMTLNGMIKEALTSEIEEIVDVKLINEE